MSLLYLLRHGQAAPRGALAGRKDYSLTPEGVAQVEARQRELAAVTFSAAWSSPLARARQTAEIILRGNATSTARITEVPELTEISLGQWEGKDKDWIRRTFPREWEARGADLAGTPPPGGESFAMLAGRVLPAFAAICTEACRHKCVLLTAHQAVNRIILARVTGMSLNQATLLPQPLAALSVLELRKGSVRLVE